MQGTSFWLSRFVVEPIVLLVLAFPAAAILIGPSPRVTSQNLDIAQKPQRPQFVPGEALVRFKPGRAFEGRMSVAVPNGDQLISRESSSSHSIEMTPEQVQVTLDRFEGSAIVDGLRIARMAPEDTRKAVRCAEGCANARPRISLSPWANCQDSYLLVCLHSSVISQMSASVVSRLK